jgi:hypothetical protein
MAMLLMVMVVGVSLGALLVPIIVNQDRTTRFDTTRIHSLHAAQAGIDVIVGKIRSSVDPSTGLGDDNRLPCGPFSGNAVSGGSDAYYVEVLYYTKDPVANPTAQAMTCADNYGPFDAVTSSHTPLYACLISTGIDESAPPSTTGGTRNTGCASATGAAGGSGANSASRGRTLVTTYVLKTDNSNISGGTIHIYPTAAEISTGAFWCLDAGSGTPAPGAVVVLQQCSTSTPTAPQQTFAYRPDLTLQLVSSIDETVGGTTYRSGLCIDDATFNAGATAPASGSGLVLNPCSTVAGTTIWSQQWSFDDFSSLQAPLASSASTTGTNGSNLSHLCMTVPSHAASTAVTLATCDQNITSLTDAWLPTPSVGGGGAVSDPDTTGTAIQWINLLQFGRCINDPGANPLQAFIIVAGCKQNPNKPSVSANQRYNYDPSTLQLFTTLPDPSTQVATKYCLYSKLSTNSNPANRLVLLTPCAGHSPTTTITDAALRWTRSTPKASPGTPYAQQYRFVDATSTPQCMSFATLTVAGDSTFSQWSKLVTATCDGSTAQQWNAANTIGTSSLKDTVEIAPR